MAILHVAIARLDDSKLKVSRAEAYKQILRIIDDIAVTKYDVRVGPPLIPHATKGYDIMLSMKFDRIEDFKAYLAHPNHLELMKRWGPLLRDMISYQVDGTTPKSKL